MPCIGQVPCVAYLFPTSMPVATGGASHYLLGHYSAARTAFLEVPKLDPLYTLLRVRAACVLTFVACVLA